MAVSARKQTVYCVTPRRGAWAVSVDGDLVSEHPAADTARDACLALIKAALDAGEDIRFVDETLKGATT